MSTDTPELADLDVVRTWMIDTTGTPPPGIKIHFLPAGGPLFLGIYMTARKGIVYRWDNGLQKPPTVIHWDLDGPPCQ